jgi:hypothetical protein
MELNCLQTVQTQNFMVFTQLISARNVALSHITDLCSVDFTEWDIVRPTLELLC